MGRKNRRRLTWRRTHGIEKQAGVRDASSLIPNAKMTDLSYWKRRMYGRVEARDYCAGFVD